VSAETLTFASLLGLPLAVAICLGLLVRSLLSGGRTWLLWLVVGVALSALWASNVLRTP
jgi:hypothetical protein